MKNGAEVTAITDITLVTLHHCPTEIGYLSELLEKIAALGVNIDMISLAPAQGALSGLSFTISDDDLGKILSFTASLRENSGIRPTVSSGNIKVTVSDERMRNTPGIAAKVFRAAASVQADLRLISTSDTEIALLVTPPDYPGVLEALERAAGC